MHALHACRRAAPRRQQELQDAHSAELGLTLYQLATTYYCHDLLADAGPALQRATALLRGHYPQDHDLVRAAAAAAATNSSDCCGCSQLLLLLHAGMVTSLCCPTAAVLPLAVSLQVVLCKHRLGMICAAGRDHRSAQQLLGETAAHYHAMQAQHPLALEAELGLAMAE